MDGTREHPELVISGFISGWDQIGRSGWCKLAHERHRPDLDLDGFRLKLELFHQLTLDKLAVRGVVVERHEIGRGGFRWPDLDLVGCGYKLDGAREHSALVVRGVISGWEQIGRGRWCLGEPRPDLDLNGCGFKLDGAWGHLELVVRGVVGGWEQLGCVGDASMGWGDLDLEECGDRLDKTTWIPGFLV